MASSIPYLIAENQWATHTVYVLMINNDHFNTLTAKNSNKFAKLDKIKKKRIYYWFARGSGGGDEIWWRWDWWR